MTGPRDVVTRYLDASNARDVDGMMRCISDDIEIRAPGGAHLTGKAAYREQVVERYLAAYPDMKRTITAMYVDSNTVIAELVETATQAGALQLATGETAPPSGRSYRSECVVIYEVRGDVIARETDYFDRHEFLQQLGLVPDKVSV